MKTMNKINLDYFLGSSSLEEALILFALGKYSFSEFYANTNCFSETIAIIKSLQKMGAKKARNLAKSFLLKNEYDLEELKDNYCNCTCGCGCC